MPSQTPPDPEVAKAETMVSPGLDADQAERLWNFYFQRMVRLARRQLRGVGKASRDEEDIALSAFKSFCLGLRNGRFRVEQDQTNLWPLLVTITLRKSIDQIRYQNRQKRNTASRGEAAPKDFDHVEISELTGQEPTAEQIVAATDHFERVLERLDQVGDPTLRTIALLSLEGESPVEIAETLQCTPRTIQRKLKTIASLWEPICEAPNREDQACE